MADGGGPAASSRARTAFCAVRRGGRKKPTRIVYPTLNRFQKCLVSYQPPLRPRGRPLMTTVSGRLSAGRRRTSVRTDSLTRRISPLCRLTTRWEARCSSLPPPPFLLLPLMTTIRRDLHGSPRIVGRGSLVREARCSSLPPPPFLLLPLMTTIRRDLHGSPRIVGRGSLVPASASCRRARCGREGG